MHDKALSTVALLSFFAVLEELMVEFFLSLRCGDKIERF